MAPGEPGSFTFEVSQAAERDYLRDSSALGKSDRDPAMDLHERVSNHPMRMSGNETPSKLAFSISELFSLIHGP
jgi:hypothetical protein